MVRVKRLLKSFSHAFRGLVKIFFEEQNLKIQTTVGLVVLIFALFLQISRLEWVLLVFVISLVILLEIVNSAVERITDVLKPRINSYVKEIKDIMAAGVLLASIAATVVGIIIFWPYLNKLFGQ